MELQGFLQSAKLCRRVCSARKRLRSICKHIGRGSSMSVVSQKSHLSRFNLRLIARENEGGFRREELVHSTRCRDQWWKGVWAGRIKHMRKSAVWLGLASLTRLQRNSMPITILQSPPLQPPKAYFKTQTTATQS